MDLTPLTQMHLFPVRHHSPRTTAVLSRWLEQVRPDVVLVEGPCDATALVEVLCDARTVPPVALLGYRTDGTQGSAMWPFAAYSPEYQALRWAREHGARAEFIDLPVGVTLTVKRTPESSSAPASGPSPVEAIARARGYRSFEEFWEADFEAPDWRPEQFRAVLLAWAAVLNMQPRDEVHRQRDAFMARQLLEVVASGVAPSRVAVVAGAAHVAAFAAGDVDLALAQRLPPAVPSTVTVIPYSFPRLSEQLGYGAGNRAPRFYQRAHDAQGDFRRATLEVLLEFAASLRGRGFTASLDDVLEAYRLAMTLASLRGKQAPGLDELREATVATLCRGDASHADAFLWKSVIGHQVGQVSSRAGRNPLQQEFWHEVDSRWLPRMDRPEPFSLQLNNALEVGTSVFLHRLRVMGVPYATHVGSTHDKRNEEQAAGGITALGRVRESWKARWTPATDAALVEKLALGITLEGVTTRVLQARLDAAKTTGAAAEVLLESVLTGCSRTVDAALRAVDSHAAMDEDLCSLASAARALFGLMAYGSSRTRSELGDDAVAALGQRTFTQALLRVREACGSPAHDVFLVSNALRTLHEAALSQPLADKEGWLAEARGLMASTEVNPTFSGLAMGLLYLARELPEDAVALALERRLSRAVAPGASALFLEGYLQVNALALVRNREVVRTLDVFLRGLRAEHFIQALPMLRRAFGALSDAERRHLLQHVTALAQSNEAASPPKLDAKEQAAMRDLNADLGKMLDDLDGLL
ncbi:hypothetical protein DRW03_34315 [Corallococcus sp. H22C18031201]|nr:hypothetical protein DRW03_34315 [Corallococcus sp. H22C18031201]